MTDAVIQPNAAVCYSTQLQREIWLAAQMSEDANCAFNESLIVELRGDLDGVALAVAITQVIRQRDMARTTLSDDGRELYGIAAEAIVLQQSELSDLDDAAADQVVQQLSHLQNHEAFPLDGGPLLRVHLITRNGQHHILLLTCHSLIGDVRALKQLSDDIVARYHNNDLSPVASHFDYASWERSEAAQVLADHSLRYWTTKLNDSTPFLEIPLDKPRPAHKGLGADYCHHTLDKTLVGQLQQRAQQHGWNVSSMMVAAYVAFMHRLTGSDDILFGLSVPVETPHGPELLGGGSKLLPIKIAIDSKQSFASLVDRVEVQVEEARQHGFLALSKLLHALSFQRDPSRPVLLSTAFIADVDEHNPRREGDLDIAYKASANRLEHLDMRWSVQVNADHAQLSCLFNEELWHSATVAMRLQEFATLLVSVAEQPDTAIADLDILPILERQRLMEVSHGPVLKPAASHLTSLLNLPRFADQVAVVCGAESLTYAELGHRSNQLAHYLITLGVEHNDLVGVFVERSVNMLVSLLAIWKAGAAYVALDPAYPVDRLLYMADSARLKALITESSVAEGLSDYCCPRVYLDRDAERIATYSPTVPTLDRDMGPEDTAYVIFTSGSTGKPKGVQITHGGVINFLMSMAKRPGLAADDRFLAVTTLSFDIAIMELCLPLLVGGRVIIARRDEALDGYRLLELIDQHQVNVMQATPTTWRWMLAAGWQGQADFKTLCGGEAFPIDLARQLLPRVAEVWNMYGPTEATVWSTCHRINTVDDLGGGSIPVGPPVDNTQCYILDEQMRLLPNGIPGELYIGGDGVANGYIGQPEKTAEVFLHNSIDNKGRLYRTGDQARWRLDGNFECLGRLDSQIKLRGYRIELGEIEAALARHADVIECAVSVASYSQSDQRLVAYVRLVEGAVLNSTAVRRYLRTFLPDFMVPQLFMEIDTLPLTPNGKVDRKKLPNPDPAQITDPVLATAHPSNDTEKSLVAIWSELLKKNYSGGVDQLFFDVGGHSLLAMDMIAMIHRQFGVRLHVLDILVNTIEQIATKIHEQSADGKTADIVATSCITEASH